MNRQKREEMRRDAGGSNDAVRNERAERTGGSPQQERVRGSESNQPPKNAPDMHRQPGELPLPD